MSDFFRTITVLEKRKLIDLYNELDATMPMSEQNAMVVVNSIYWNMINIVIEIEDELHTTWAC